MTITGFYVMNDKKKEKVKSYSMIGFKLALMVVLLTLDVNSASYAFKLNNVVNLR